MSCAHATLRAASNGVCPVCPPELEHPAGGFDFEARVWATRRALDAKKARRSLADFLRQGWHVLEPGTELDWNWHIQAVCDHVEKFLLDWLAVKRGEIRPEDQPCQNLQINVPPGSLKSRIVSVYAPAWFWLHYPEWSVICLSANPEVARRDSDHCKELIRSEWYREGFEVEWTVEKDAVEKWTTSAGGRRISKGLNAKITGQRSDALFVDDPHDAEEANSDPKRKSVCSRWDTSGRNRLNDLRFGLRLVIMQRLHEEDFCGHTFKTGDWSRVCIPMEWEGELHDVEDDKGNVTTNGHPFAHGPNHPTVYGWIDPRHLEGVPRVMHPERFTIEVLASERRGLGSYGYAGQMQQLPAPSDGGVFKKSWWGYFDDLPTKVTQTIISVDPNAKKTKDGSRFAVVVGSRRKKKVFIRKVYARIVDFPEACQVLRDIRKEFPRAQIIVEGTAAGPAIVSAMSIELGNVIEWKTPGDDKESRGRACAPTVESGDVSLQRGAPWLDDFLHEMSVFPRGAKDDIVDAFTQLILKFRGSPESDLFLRAWGSRS